MAYESGYDRKHGHNGSGREPRELEAKLEHTRAEIDETLAAIEHKLTPGELVDEAIDYLRHHGPGEFVSNLAEQWKERPLPAALSAVGAAWATKKAANVSVALARKPLPTALPALGVAWFMRESAKRTRTESDRESERWPDADRFERHDWSRSTVGELRERVADPARAATQRVSEAAHRVEHLKPREVQTCKHRLVNKPAPVFDAPLVTVMRFVVGGDAIVVFLLLPFRSAKLGLPHGCFEDLLSHRVVSG